MGSKMKVIVGIALVIGVVSIAFLADPIQAYVNGASNGDLNQAQDRDRLRTQDRNCACDGTCIEYRHRNRTNQFAANRIRNCTMSLERFGNQNRERTRS